MLDGIALVPMDDAILKCAADLDPVRLRTLDAIHLATALILGDDLEGLVTYDGRLAEAGAGVGLPVLAPGVRPA